MILVGGGLGTWQRYHEAQDPKATQQNEENWCVLACAEMLTSGQVTQENLSKFVSILPIGVSPAEVATVLNELAAIDKRLWISGFIDLNDPHDAFRALNDKTPWAAMMSIGNGRHHMIVIDGLDVGEMVLVRDPWRGTRYEIELYEFLSNWTQIALFYQ